MVVVIKLNREGIGVPGSKLPKNIVEAFLDRRKTDF